MSEPNRLIHFGKGSRIDWQSSLRSLRFKIEFIFAFHAQDEMKLQRKHIPAPLQHDADVGLVLLIPKMTSLKGAKRKSLLLKN
jgi:hypothetical protein